MERNSTNSENTSILAQLELLGITLPAEALQSFIHAIAVKQDTNMTRVYSVIQPKESD